MIKHNIPRSKKLSDAILKGVISGVLFGAAVGGIIGITTGQPSVGTSAAIG